MSTEGFTISLSVTVKGALPRVYVRSALEITLGRKAELNDIHIQEGNISRQHCKISLLPDGKARVIDLNSTNGVSVNNEPEHIRRPRLLGPSDSAYLADIQLRVLDVSFHLRPAPHALIEEAARAQTSTHRLFELMRAGLAVQRVLACRPDLPNEIALGLLRVPDVELLRALAQNPAAPCEVLADLAPHFPREVAQNPAFPILRLEDPGLLWLPETARAKILPAPEDAPPQNIALYRAGALSDQYSSIYDYLRRASAAQLVPVVERFGDQDLLWDELFLPAYDERRAQLAALAPDLFAPHAAREPLPEVRALLGHATTRQEILALLAEDPFPEVRAALAHNRALSPYLAEQLAHDPDPEVSASFVEWLSA
jgi:hypothetical protein